MTPEERMRRLRDEDRWTTSAPTPRRAMPRRVVAAHWAVTIVVVAALVVGAVAGAEVLRSGGARFAAPTEGMLQLHEDVARLALTGSWTDADAQVVISTQPGTTALSVVESKSCGYESGYIAVAGNESSFFGYLEVACGAPTEWWADVTTWKSIDAEHVAFLDAEGGRIRTLTRVGSEPEPRLNGDGGQIDATAAGDLEGVWRPVGFPTDAVTFKGDSWSTGTSCPGGVWAVSGANWSATSPPPTPHAPCLVRTAADGDGSSPASAWITSASWVGMVGEELRFYGSDGKELGALVRASAAPAAEVGPLGAWKARGASFVIRESGDGTFETDLTRSCGTVAISTGLVAGQIRMAAAGGRLCGKQGPRDPEWVFSAMSYRASPGTLELMDRTGRVVLTATAVGGGARTLPSFALPVGARVPSSDELLGDWVDRSSGAAVAFFATGWSSGDNSSNSLLGADGGFCNWGGVVNGALAKEPPAFGPLLSGTHAVGMVGDELVFYAADGSELGALVRK